MTRVSRHSQSWGIWFRLLCPWEWIAISYSRGSFQPRDQTHISCTGRWILYCCTPGKSYICTWLQWVFMAHRGSFLQWLDFSSCGSWAVAHSMWDLIIVPRPGTEPCIRGQILNHWATKEVPGVHIYFYQVPRKTPEHTTVWESQFQVRGLPLARWTTLE